MPAPLTQASFLELKEALYLPLPLVFSPPCLPVSSPSHHDPPSRLLPLPPRYFHPSLQRHDATVTVLHAGSPHPSHISRDADIMVVAAGTPALVTADWLKPGCVVVDVGINAIEVRDDAVCRMPYMSCTSCLLPSNECITDWLKPGCVVVDVGINAVEVHHVMLFVGHAVHAMH